MRGRRGKWLHDSTALRKVREERRGFENSEQDESSRPAEIRPPESVRMFMWRNSGSLKAEDEEQK